MQKLKKTAVCFILLYIVLNLALLPERSLSAAKNALYLCINLVIPSLFPFFIATNIFVLTGLSRAASPLLSPFMMPLFGIGGGGAAAVLMGFLSGYPVGAATAARLFSHGDISKDEAERLLAFTNNSGPMFIIGALGVGMLSSPKIGYMLFLSHILSAVFVGIIFKFRKKKEHIGSLCLPRGEFEKTDISSAIAESVNLSVQTMLKVCGFVILFSVICSFIPKTAFYPEIYSLFEITGGLRLLSASALGYEEKLCFISFFLGFSGLSVFFQVKSIISDFGLSIKPCIIGKTMQGIFSFFITKFLLKYFITYSPASSAAEPLYDAYLPESLWLSSLVIIFFALIFILLLLILGFFLDKKAK